MNSAEIEHPHLVYATCCKNTSDSPTGKFRPCERIATHWYQHGEDVCSFCDEHDYPCGTPVDPVSLGVTPAASTR